VFDEQMTKKDSRITISFFEIYNEKIFDLLNSTMKPLEIREAKSGELSIPGLSFVEVVSMKEVINYLAEGIKVLYVFKFSEPSDQFDPSQHKIFQITFNFPCQV
jgi:hypothetical protein